jgi:hypothetical protein
MRIDAQFVNVKGTTKKADAFDSLSILTGFRFSFFYGMPKKMKVKLVGHQLPLVQPLLLPFICCCRCSSR